VEATSPPAARRTLTPAVLLAAAFTTACALASIGFVAARGGLLLPVATTEPSASVAPSVAPGPAPTPDPLTALPACPGFPGCYVYTIRRGDTLSTISDRWLISIPMLEALNPQVVDPATIVVGQWLYLGRSPFVRLDRCPDAPGCYLYVVRAGDRLSTIAGRFGITTIAILALNPRITDPNAIYSGQTIRLPGPTP
jgi:LysM domain